MKNDDLYVKSLEEEIDQLKSENRRLRMPWAPGERKRMFEEDRAYSKEWREDMLAEAREQTHLLKLLFCRGR